jgi:DNA-binding beta-propeller fold protein YncE
MTIGVIAAALCGAVLVSSSSADPVSRTAYVIGSLDGSIARVDLETADVDPQVATTGSSPNRIQASADGTFALVAASGADEVDLFDIATESIIAVVQLPSDSNPWTCEIAGGRLFTTALLADKVYEIHPTAGVIDSFPSGTAPEGMCIASGKLYVANTGFDFSTFTYGPGTVTVFDLGANTVVDTIPVELNPQECLLTPDGLVHVVCTGDFFGTTGAIAIIDPDIDTVIDTIPIDQFPGGGAVDPTGIVYLSITTHSFSSEIWAYDTALHLFLHDGSNPLLATPDFLGNPRIGSDGLLYVTNFTQDLLLVEDPADPGSPLSYLVGDGPVDLALIDKEEPVSLTLSGLWAVNTAEGIRLSWRANVQSDLASFVIDRAKGGSARFIRVAQDLPIEREAQWTDANVEEGKAYLYRVGGMDVRGEIVWLPALSIARTGARADLFARAFPNPFREETTLRLHAPANSVRLEIFDLSGRRILARELSGAAGRVDWVWNGRDESGRDVAPGAYPYRVTMGTRRITDRIIRVR